MKTKKMVFIVPLVIVGLLLLAGVGGFIVMSQNAAKGQSQLVIHDIDLAQVADGEYEGEADSGMVYVKVNVTVKDHKITDVELIKHKNGLGAKAEVIVDDIVSENRVTVDSISGATLSSNTIKSAVTDALDKGVSESAS